jgi:hypothetical protein
MNNDVGVGRSNAVNPAEDVDSKPGLGQMLTNMKRMIRFGSGIWREREINKTFILAPSQYPQVPLTLRLAIGTAARSCLIDWLI